MVITSDMYSEDPVPLDRLVIILGMFTTLVPRQRYVKALFFPDFEGGNAVL